MTRHLTSAALFCSLTLAPLASAADPNPMELLEAADAACAAVRTASYTAFTSIGSLSSAGHQQSFRVWVDKWEPDPPAPPAPGADASSVPMMPMSIVPAHRLNSTLKADVRVEIDDGRVIVSDGDDAFLIDYSKLKIVQRALSNGGEAVFDEQGCSLVVRTPLLDTRSFIDETKDARLVMYLGTDEYDGVVCNHVLINRTMADDQEMAMHWFFGVDDHLPRYLSVQAADFVITLEFRDLAVDAILPSTTFAIPAGEFEVEVVKPPPPRVPLEPGTAMPDFELPAPDGTMVSAAELRGSIVVLDFWGTWCGPCLSAMPQIQKLHETYGPRGVRIIGLACRERDRNAPAALMADKGYTYELLLDGDSVVKSFQVPGYPTLFVIDAEGNVAHSHVGMSDDLYADLSAVIDRLLKTGD